MRLRWALLILLAAGAAAPFVAGFQPGLKGYPALAPPWSQRIIGPPGMEERDEFWFGKTISPAGDVNADGYDDVVVLSSSRAYLYFGSASGLNAVPAEVDTPRGYWPAHVAAPGDVDGDGYADLLVGFSSSGGSLLQLRYGGPGGLVARPGWTMAAEADAGASLRPVAAGDVNGDGRPDWAVVAKGEVSLYTDPGAAPVWRAAGTDAAPAGDVNGDGFGDLAVLHQDRRCQVYFGAAAGLPSQPSWVSGEGTDLAAADFNGDGISDLAIAGKRQVGVYHGSSGGPGAQPNKVLRLGLLERYDPHVYAAGDVDGDGFADLAVQAGSNRVLVYRGSAGGLSGWPRWSMRDRSRQKSKVAPAGVGDVNGDGRADMAVGLPRSSSDGNVVLYAGGAAGPAGTVLFLLLVSLGLLLAPAATWLLVHGFRVFRQAPWPLAAGFGLLAWLVLVAWLL